MVLVVDDEELVCSSLCDYLASIGYRVTGARSGRQALELAQNKDFAAAIRAVVTDVNMPGLSGPEMWLQMKHLVTPSCAILFMSGRGNVLQPANELPGEMLAKPFPLELLRDKLARLIGTGTAGIADS